MNEARCTCGHAKTDHRRTGACLVVVDRLFKTKHPEAVYIHTDWRESVVCACNRFRLWGD